MDRLADAHVPDTSFSAEISAENCDIIEGRHLTLALTYQALLTMLFFIHAAKQLQSRAFLLRRAEQLSILQIHAAHDRYLGLKIIAAIHHISCASDSHD